MTFLYYYSVTNGHGQHCCYDNNGNLITGPPDGGTVDLWSEEVSPAKHYHADVEPFIVCCRGDLPNSQYYYEKRPSDNGARFNPRPCSEHYEINMKLMFT